MQKQILLPDELRKNIPPLYTQENKKDPTVYVKFFNPYGAGTWFVLEFDGDDTLFCYVELLENEFGYVALKELEELPAYISGKAYPGIQGIERDEHFTPCRLSQCSSFKPKD